ncbi:uncharacterized protein [Gorilla gorilla gorilla]|uniref:uncharacterized protein n=1 Tax=Gorilla gorilla gorilla TaxID=9595 RepID=UPI00300B79B5
MSAQGTSPHGQTCHNDFSFVPLREVVSFFIITPSQQAQNRPQPLERLAGLPGQQQHSELRAPGKARREWLLGLVPGKAPASRERFPSPRAGRVAFQARARWSRTRSHSKQTRSAAALKLQSRAACPSAALSRGAHARARLPAAAAEPPQSAQEAATSSREGSRPRLPLVPAMGTMARLEAPQCPGFLARLLGGTWCLLYIAGEVCGDQSQGAVFLREFTLIRRESLHEDFLSDLLNSHKTEDSCRLKEGEIISSSNR